MIKLLATTIVVMFSVSAHAWSHSCHSNMTPGQLSIQLEKACPSQVSASLLPDAETAYCVVTEDPKLLEYLQRVVSRTEIYHAYPGCYRLNADKSEMTVSESW